MEVRSVLSLAEPAHTYSLTKNERLYLKHLINENVPKYDSADFMAFSQACTNTSKDLPQSIISWSSEVKKNGIGLLKNLPLDRVIPKTPTIRYKHDGIPMFSDSVLATISTLFGLIYTFEGKFTTRHIHNIYPTYEDRNSQMGYSMSELEWHVEDGFCEERANWIGLLCLRGDKNVRTKIARSRDIVSFSKLPQIPFQPQFHLRFDDSFQEGMKSKYTTVTTLTKTDNDLEIIYDPYYTECKDTHAKEALKLVKQNAEDVCLNITLGEGDAVFFNNRTTIHARNGFEPKMDGSDRWLKRVIVIEKKNLQQSLRNGTISQK